MKRFFRRLVRILSLSLALMLAAVFLPYAKDFLHRLLPQGKYERISTLLTHELEEAGELTAIRYTDTGIMHTETNALFIGSVQKVTVPYAYEIGLGFPLSEVRITALEHAVEVTVPPIRMLYDSFRVTDDPEVEDFWYHLTESSYQKMLDDQALACRESYLDREPYLKEAWDAACKALQALFSQWTDEAVAFTFIPAPDI